MDSAAKTEVLCFSLFPDTEPLKTEVQIKEFETQFNSLILFYFTFTFHFHALERKWQPTPVFLPGESQGRGSRVGCHLWGRTEPDTTEVT